MRVIERNGRWGVDYDEGTDAQTGKRRRRFKPCTSEADAYRSLADMLDDRFEPEPDPAHLLRSYVPKFLAACRARGLSERTVERYGSAIDNHLLPAFGDVPLQRITREALHALLAEKLADPHASRQGLKRKGQGGKLARGSVRQLLNTMQAIFAEARFDPKLSGLANPCEGLAKRLKLNVADDGSQVRAMRHDQFSRLLGAAKAIEPAHFAAFAFMGWAGLRQGEVLGVKESDIDFKRGVLTLAQGISGRTKSGKTRVVDLAAPLLDVLRGVVESNHASRRNAKVVAMDGSALHATSARGPYLLYPEIPANPTRKDRAWMAKRLQRAIAECLKTAELPDHFTCHSLRHTYAANLIAANESPAYVQKQMGHASVSLTVDTYASWFPVDGKGAADRHAKASLPAIGAEMDPKSTREEQGKTAETLKA